MPNRTGHRLADGVNKEMADEFGRRCEDSCASMDNRTLPREGTLGDYIVV